MISRYRILHQVDLRHDYYGDGTCPDFAFQPSFDTGTLLADRRLRCKMVGNKLLVLVQVDENGRPTIPLPADLRLVFHLDLLSTAFLTVTNVDAAALRSRRFHFTNLSGNAAGAGPAQVLNLSRPIAAYDAARTYLPGQFSALGADVFECIGKTLGVAPPVPGNAFWVAKGPTQFASTSDMVPFRTRAGAYTLSLPASVIRLRVFGLDPAANTYTALLRDEVLQDITPEVTANAVVDLGALPPGRYRVDLNGESFEAWFDDEAVARGVFGVLELYHHLPASNAYSPVDPAGTVRELTQAIHFGNRRAFWKYVTPLRKVDTLLHSADHALPSPFTSGSNDPAVPAQRDFFVSNRPLALTEAPGENLFDLMVGSEARPAPKPDPRLPGILTQTFDGALSAYTDSICTIRLNH